MTPTPERPFQQSRAFLPLITEAGRAAVEPAANCPREEQSHTSRLAALTPASLVARGGLLFTGARYER
jgi:hypothetical protein